MKKNGIEIRMYCESQCPCPTCHIGIGTDGVTEVEKCVYCQLKWAGKGQYAPGYFDKKNEEAEPVKEECRCGTKGSNHASECVNYSLNDWMNKPQYASKHKEECKHGKLCIECMLEKKNCGCNSEIKLMCNEHLDKEEVCSPHIYNIDKTPKVCMKCGEDLSEKQPIELPLEITMKEVGEYAAKTECEINEALTYVLWIRYQKLIKYLKARE